MGQNHIFNADSRLTHSVGSFFTIEELCVWPRYTIQNRVPKFLHIKHSLSGVRLLNSYEAHTHALHKNDAWMKHRRRDATRLKPVKSKCRLLISYEEEIVERSQRPSRRV